MKKIFLFFFLLIFIVFIVLACRFGCKTSRQNKVYDTYHNIYERYNNLKSYTSQINVTIISNLTSKKYLINEYYKSPDKYRTDCLSPDEIKGFKYIFREKEVYFYSPYDDIGKKTTALSVSNEKNCMCLIDFLSNFYNTQDASVLANKNMLSEIIFETSASSKNEKHFSQKLWFDRKTELPIKLVTYDINNNTVLSVEYKDFKINEKISDSLFEKFEA